MIQSMAVFCGSKSGNNKRFMEEAYRLGQLLAQHQITVVYGGGNKGIMGAVANGALENNGKVTGIIPRFLVDLEHKHQHLTEEVITADMHTRKKILYERCDAAVILPGGFGTLDELFEMLTWNQLSIHNKRIFILNTSGFYDALNAHIQMMESEGFLYEKTTERITILSASNDIIQYLC
jgi:uncharacterized protein (TIGR00730 family)